MEICILCPDKDITVVRGKAKKMLPIENPLKIGLSPTGVAPATHWFCYLTATEDVFNKLLAKKEFTIIEESGTEQFLKK